MGDNIRTRLSPEEKIRKAIEYIEGNYTGKISREEIAVHIGAHPDNMGKYFKKYLGKTVNEHINGLRIRDAVAMLINTDERIIDIAYSVGFESLRTFNRVFMERMKTSPVIYREKNGVK